MDANANGNEEAGKTPPTANAKKRLLPMELRRRRKAAKLQITSEKNVATISATDIINQLDDGEPTSAEDLTTATTTTTTTGLNPSTRDSGQEERNAQPVVVPTTAVSRPPSPPASTTRQLQSLFSFSLLDRKRQQQQQREALVDVPLSFQRLPRIPLDLTPKSKAVISMTCVFPFIRPRASSVAVAMTSEVSDVPEVRWLRALQYYVHPASPLPPSLTVANDKQIEETEFYVQRFRLWQSSFRHAYFGFRRLQNHGTLYVRYPEFVACFYIDGGKSRDAEDDSIVGLCRKFVSIQERGTDDGVQPRPRRLCAVVSHSNARLRKDLHHRGIEFHVPFNTKALQKPLGNLNNIEDDEWHSHTTTASTPQEMNVHGVDSLLHFSGHLAVHGLYEFLLNRKPLSNQDVAEIIAHQPFANAAIRSLDVRFMGKTDILPRDNDPNDVSSTTPTVRSEVEVTGFCTTTAISKLLDCLQTVATDSAPGPSTTPTTLKVAMETAPMCERLNALMLDQQLVKPDSRTKFTSQERQQWKQQLEFARRRLQAIRTSDSMASVDVDMTTRER